MYLALQTARKLDGTVGKREQRIVSTASDEIARMKVRAALTNENGSRRNDFTGETLYSETLCF